MKNLSFLLEVEDDSCFWAAFSLWSSRAAHLLPSKKTLNQVEATALPVLRVPESWADLKKLKLRKKSREVSLAEVRRYVGSCNLSTEKLGIGLCLIITQLILIKYYDSTVSVFRSHMACLSASTVALQPV